MKKLKKLKAITPIISIIILLLITVGLAAAAWAYMSNYLSTLTAKTIEIPTQKCIGGTNAMAIIHNMGTESISIANDIIVMQGGTGVTPRWCSINEDCASNTATSITAGGYVKMLVPNCCTVGTTCPRTCTYDVILAGRSQSVTVYCTG